MLSRRDLFVVVLSLVLSGMLVPVLMPETAYASDTIYIKSDGSILPSGVNITTADSRTYTFTGNVNDSVIIQRDSIVVDGAGYRLTGTGENAFSLTYRINVTIKNVKISNSHTGILLDTCSFCNVTSNALEDNSWHAIYLDSSSNNSISYNNITGNSNRAIYLYYSSGNSLIGNEIGDNYKGVELGTLSHRNNISDNVIWDNLNEAISLSGHCDHNSICRNNVTSNKGSSGIAIGNSADNRVCDNRLTNNTNTGLTLSQSSNCTITGNEAAGNFYGIRIMYSNGTMMRDNVMFSNDYDFSFWFIEYSNFPNDVDQSNTVEGRPIIYWTGKQSMTVPTDAGIVIIFNCTDMTIQNLSIADATWDAVVVAYCTNTTIANNHIANSQDCIYLWNCSSCNVTSNSLEGFMSLQLFNSTANIVFNNTITGGGNMGAVSIQLSRDNTFYRNNFTNNYYDALVDEQWPNNWDHGYEDGGNYWDNYVPRFHSNARDEYSGPNQDQLGSDGYWDLPYPLNDNNTDRYALVPEYSSILTLLLLVSTTPLTIAVARRRRVADPKRSTEATHFCSHSAPAEHNKSSASSEQIRPTMTK